MRAMKDSGIAWIGEIPAEWRMSRVGLHYDIILGKMLCTTQPNDDYTLEPYYCAANIHFDGISNEAIKEMWFSATEKELYSVKEDDLLVVEGGAGAGGCAIVTGLQRNMYIQNSVMIVRSKAGNSSQFLRYLIEHLVKSGYIDVVCNKATIPHFTKDKLANVPIPLSSEQRRISAFLDTECARIDAVIEKTRASIEEYKKLKQSVITQAVTKGIRPGRKMKDSGIEWIGEIPEEWAVRRIKTIFSLRDERNYLPLEEVNLISLYTDLGVVQHSDLEKITGNKASNADGYKIVHENDIIVNIILCWMGAIGRSAYSGVTSPAYDIYVPSDEIECRFYHHYFRTKGFSGDCYKRGKGIMAMRWRTYSDQFRDIHVVLPPIAEQREILNYLDSRTDEIEMLITKKERFLAEMESYKKSLIFEYITGKKGVDE